MKHKKMVAVDFDSVPGLWRIAFSDDAGKSWHWFKSESLYVDRELGVLFDAGFRLVSPLDIPGCPW